MERRKAVRTKHVEPFALLVSRGHPSLVCLLGKCWALKAVEDIDFSS